MLKKLKSIVLDLVFPPRCLFCNQIGHFVCNDCLSKIIKISKQSCPFCQRINKNGKLCVRCRQKHQLSGLMSYGYYRDPILKKVIHQYKYEGIFAACDELSLLLFGLVEESGLSFDFVVNVPASRKRKNERGYNQSELLAKSLALRLYVPWLDVLKKPKHTRPQVGQSRKERLANIKEVFLITDNPLVRGKKILLVDDVFTTGTTLDECAKVLRAAGAHQVWGLVLAKE